MRDIIKIATVNFTSVWGDKEKNLRHISEYAEAAGRQGVNMILFPETSLSGYNNDKQHAFADKMHVKLAETIPGPTTIEISKLAKQYNMYILFGMPEFDADTAKVYNSVAAVCPDGRFASHRKIHLPMFLDEHEWAERGDTPVCFDTEWGPVGISICFETYNFPELARYYRAKGARLLVNATAIPDTAFTKNSARMSISANALTLPMFYATAGLTGYCMGDKFAGGSGVTGPNIRGDGTYTYFGKLVGDDDSDNEEMFVGTINLALADEVGPVHIFSRDPDTKIRDWRPELYTKWFAEF